MTHALRRSILCALLGGCGAAPAATPDAGPVGPVYCTTNMGADGAVAPTFANVQKLFDWECAACHQEGAPEIVDLRAGKSFAALVNQVGPTDEACGGALVTPGDLAASYLWTKLTTVAPCVGMQMPRSEFGSSSLVQCELDVIQGWILAGAPSS